MERWIDGSTGVGGGGISSMESLLCPPPAAVDHHQNLISSGGQSYRHQSMYNGTSSSSTLPSFQYAGGVGGGSAGGLLSGSVTGCPSPSAGVSAVPVAPSASYVPYGGECGIQTNGMGPTTDVASMASYYSNMYSGGGSSNISAGGSVPIGSMTAAATGNGDVGGGALWSTYPASLAVSFFDSVIQRFLSERRQSCFPFQT